MIIATPEGSSPLARGLPGHPFQDAAGLRIIPARAGFTSSSSWPGIASTDHPRSRGVYQFKSNDGKITVGSSPLARGLPLCDDARLEENRIIPARAGFTLSPKGGRGAFRDHPRSRGVYSGMPLSRLARGGSSPLARGLRRQGVRRRHGHRIIPARAGFTASGGPHRPRPPDHPRSRGVYSAFHTINRKEKGSSPLARGLLILRSHNNRGRRIIPARAGFTTHPVAE